MQDPSRQRGRSRLGSIASRLSPALLAAGGLALFLYVVGRSGVTVSMLRGVGLDALLVLVGVSAAVMLLDTVAWTFAVRHVARPHFGRLFVLKLAGDALTNGLPGGVVLGEPYKALMLRAWHGVSLADNAAVLVVLKLCVALSQVVFVLAGLTLAYPLLRDRSHELVGFHGAHLAALGLTAGLVLVLGLSLWFFVRGRSFADVARLLALLPLSPLRRFLSRRAEGIAALDRAASAVLKGNLRNLAVTFLAYELGWFVGVVETYLLLGFLGLPASVTTALVIESVGSLFRLIFFMFPSGIGGQDASFLALFRLYGFGVPAGGAFVLLKRGKEAVWIAVGFLFVALLRRSHRAAAKSAERDGSSS
ncbi:MAG: flippase-like domain-containing protein [Deltaproteobacteria bacterium]|nr:flippase-like domain-containing protein [Deltaproteobacteria bacterium]